jgi:hypothetical protein
MIVKRLEGPMTILASFCFCGFDSQMTTEGYLLLKIYIFQGVHDSQAVRGSYDYPGLLLLLQVQSPRLAN